MIANIKNKIVIQEMQHVFLYSEFVSSTLIKNPEILVDLLESGDLERSYPDGEYKLKIDHQISKIKDNINIRPTIDNITPIIDNITPIIDNIATTIDNIAPTIDNMLLKINDMVLKELLGKIRKREMVRIAWQDLTGKVSLEQTMKDLSDLAEACVQKAINFIYDKLCFIYGTPLDSFGKIQQIIVLGMGKLGAGELNFSSDIDLIFAYPEDAPFEGVPTGATHGKLNTTGEFYSRLNTTGEFYGKLNTTGEFFTKMCKNFLKVFDSSMVSSTISNSTLFRVDTRLRPFGANGPIAMSFYTMEEYYQTQGRDWERYALIKARPIAGDIDAGYSLLKILNPFVYRRYFDYGSFDALREMKKKISLQVKDKKFKNNIKLGPGGIREIEFFGQVFQLIRGGVEPEFQELKILKILDLLVQRNCIDARTGEELAKAYNFLRKVEHRLQEYDDRQTHDLPEKENEKLRLALSMGLNSQIDLTSFNAQLDLTGLNSQIDLTGLNSQLDLTGLNSQIDLTDFDHSIYDVFSKELNSHMTRVHNHFRNLFASENEDKQDDEIDELKYIWENINDPQFEPTGYKISGFQHFGSITDMLRNVAEHPNTKKLTTNGRKRLDRLIPLLIHRVGEEKKLLNPETVLQRLLSLIITIERRTCYLSLLIEKPQALDNLVNLATKSPWIISFLSLHPALLDELLAPSTLYTPPDRAQMEKDIERRMAHIPMEDFEFQLEELCIFKQIMTLRVAAADLSGNYPLMKVSDRLTEIAETVMNKVIEISWHHTVKKYGVPSGLFLTPNQETPNQETPNQETPNQATPNQATPNQETHNQEKTNSSSLFTSYSSLSSSKFFSPGFAAIAYGKLGGIELGYKSDLDMVFIYSGSEGYTEGGPRNIENIRFYTFLGQRIINALTLHTQAGKLYEADMRLRPSGEAGMIVSHIDAFNDYIKNEAWTWEHQAIIRARPIAGDSTLQNQFNAIRKKILRIKRVPELLKKEVREMRERIRKEHFKSVISIKPKSYLFDLKHSKGGIIDIEFLVQYLVLQHSSDHPALTQWTDNVRLLETLANEQILTSEEAKLLKSGYLKLRQMMHHLNLQEREKSIPIETFKDEANSISTIFDKYLSESNLNHV